MSHARAAWSMSPARSGPSRGVGVRTSRAGALQPPSVDAIVGIGRRGPWDPRGGSSCGGARERPYWAAARVGRMLRCTLWFSCEARAPPSHGIATLSATRKRALRVVSQGLPLVAGVEAWSQVKRSVYGAIWRDRFFFVVVFLIFLRSPTIVAAKRCSPSPLETNPLAALGRRVHQAEQGLQEAGVFHAQGQEEEGPRRGGLRRLLQDLRGTAEKSTSEFFPRVRSRKRHVFVRKTSVSWFKRAHGWDA